MIYSASGSFLVFSAICQLLVVAVAVYFVMRDKRRAV